MVNSPLATSCCTHSSPVTPFSVTTRTQLIPPRVRSSWASLALMSFSSYSSVTCPSPARLLGPSDWPAASAPPLFTAAVSASGSLLMRSLLSCGSSCPQVPYPPGISPLSHQTASVSAAIRFWSMTMTWPAAVPSLARLCAICSHQQRHHLSDSCPVSCCLRLIRQLLLTGPVRNPPLFFFSSSSSSPHPSRISGTPVVLICSRRWS